MIAVYISMLLQCHHINLLEAPKRSPAIAFQKRTSRLMVS